MIRHTSVATFALLTSLGCTSEVPLGDGTGGAAGAATGGAAGAGTGGSAGAGTGGSAGAATGGTAGIGGTAGSGGSAGAAGGGGTGGATACVPAATKGSLTELVSDAAKLFAVAESGDTLYYAVANANAATTLGSVKKDGTGKTTLLSSKDPAGYTPTVLDTDSTHLYWLAGGIQTHAYRRPLAGGVIETMNSSPMVGASTALAATASKVFWSNSGSAIYSAPKGVDLPSLAYGVTQGRMAGISMASNGNDVVWIEWVDPNDTLVSTHIIRKGNESAAPAQTIASFSTFHPGSLNIDATDAYIGVSGKEITRVSLAGGSLTSLHAGQITSHIATDATHVYFLENDGDCRALKSVPKVGGTVVTMATGLPGPSTGFAQGNNVDVDATDVFVGTYAGKIFKVSK